MRDFPASRFRLSEVCDLVKSSFGKSEGGQKLHDEFKPCRCILQLACLATGWRTAQSPEKPSGRRSQNNGYYRACLRLKMEIVANRGLATTFGEYLKHVCLVPWLRKGLLKARLPFGAVVAPVSVAHALYLVDRRLQALN